MKKGLHRMVERPRVPGMGTRVTASVIPSGDNGRGRGLCGRRSYLLTKIVSKEQGRVSNCLSR